MKNVSFFMVLFLSLHGCVSKEESFTTNPQLIAEFNKYLAYADTSGIFTPDDSYIYFEIHNSGKDSINVFLAMGTGAYSIINPMDSIIDFFYYKKHMVMLVGDYPNKLIDIPRMLNKDIRKEVLLKYFKDDYDLYLKDPFLLKPRLADPMEMSLVFNSQGVMVKSEKVFH